MENEQSQINKGSDQSQPQIEVTSEAQSTPAQPTEAQPTVVLNEEKGEAPSTPAEQEEEQPKTSVGQKIANVISWVLLVITALIMVFTIFSSAVFNKEDKKVFGVSMLIVLSDSMKKTDFAAGDLIFIQDVDPKTLKEGDIICFTSQNKENFGETVTHKIKSKTTVPEKVRNEFGEEVTVYLPAFITYGTTTGTEDASPVTYEWIKGKYVGKVPYAGHVFNFLKTPWGYVCIILIPFVLLIGYQIFNAIRAYKAYRGEQKDEIKEERKSLEKEREENKKVMEEMLALKAQLEAMKAQMPTGQSEPPKTEDASPTPKE